MIKIHPKNLFLIWAFSVVIAAGGILEAKEPIAAPAEYGAIPSPRIVPKTAPARNQDLLKLVEEAIEISGRRYLIANEHSPWQIYHGMGALRREFLLDLNGELIPAIDWISTTNPKFRDTPWFEKTVYGGRAHRYTVPYHFEGHPNQSMALMVLCNLPITHTFQTDGGPITVAEIINNTKIDINPQEELTWTLWFLTHYLRSDETWLTRRGETWGLERLVQDQINTQVTKAACGGTHNLYALSVARNNHVRQGGTIRGVWLQADQKIKRYMVAARSLQRRDGSYPTYYFRGYGNPKSFSEQIASTGHIMEWLMVAVDDKQLSEEWIERSIRYIAQKLVDNRNESAECGPLYHAVSALALYRDRAKGIPWPDPAVQPEIQKTVEPEAELAKEEAPLPKVSVTTPGTLAEPVMKEAIPVPEPASASGITITPAPLSVTEQSANGKVSAGIDEPEPELEFELPAKTAEKPKVEIELQTLETEVPEETEELATPEKEDSTKK